MEVITLTGGFRGLGIPSTSEVTTLVTTLNATLAPAAALIDRVRAADSSGQLGTASAARLENLWNQISQEHEALVNSIADETDLPAWQERARLWYQRVGAFVRDARAVLGDESANRGLRLTLIALGSVAVFGGIAWVVYRYGKRKHPGRRRRR